MVPTLKKFTVERRRQVSQQLLYSCVMYNSTKFKALRRHSKGTQTQPWEAGSSGMSCIHFKVK